jgi:TonB family protein
MSPWFAILLAAALKSTAVIGSAWILAFVLRRQSAAARHLVWTAAVTALLALPILSVSMPALRVRTSALSPLVSGIAFRTTAVAGQSASAPSGPQTAHDSQSAPIHAPWQSDFRWLIPFVWAAGMALALAHMLAAWIVMWHKRRTARPLGDSLFPALARQLGIKREVALLEIPHGGMPLSFGVVHPAVFLPADAREWSEERRRVVMLHELAHIRRGDLAAQLIARAAVSLFWWNPLVWMAWREFVKERERAADDLVLTAGEPATAYATQLLEIARSMQSVPVLVSAAVAMARPSQLEGRLVAILDARVNRKSLSPRAPLAAAALAIGLVAPFAALQAQDKPDVGATIRQDKPDAAMPDVEATIRAAIAQQNHEILDTAAAAYLSARKYDAAQELLESSLTIRANTSGDRSSTYALGLMKLGDLSARRGKSADAIDFYARAVGLGDTPETAPGLVYLASRSLANKDTVAAESFIDRALAAAPSGKDAGRALTVKGNIALANGLTGVAELQYQQALAQDPPGSPEAALTMETYARLLTSQDRQGEADTLLAQAKPIRQAQIDRISTPMPRLMTDSGHPEGQIVSTDGRFSIAKVGNGVSPPVMVNKREPEYSVDALSAKLQGAVVLSITIGIDGMAHDLKLVKSLGFGLDEKAAEAVSQWQFKPGTRGGAPVPVEATVEVNFRLL